ncbi:MAG: hypothetical protein EBY39_14235, partial [Flavobacteriia bacterium]|nr:hypothetical protein [Flavobacteriia bacterium]
MDNWDPFSLIDSEKVQGPPVVDQNADILKSVEKQLIKQRSSEMSRKGADVSGVKRKYNYLLNKVSNPNENVFDHAIEKIRPGVPVSGKGQFKLMKELYGIGEKPSPSWVIKGNPDYLLPPFIGNKSIDTDYKRHGFKYGGKVPEDGSALATNFGGARAYESGRKYQSRNMSAMFYAGQTQTMGLEEDRAELQKQISEEERKRNEEAQKRAQKKAERRQLLTSLVSSIALGAISSGISSVTNDMALNGTFGGKAQSKAILRQKGIPPSSVDYLLKHNPGMDEVHAQMLLTNAKSGLIPHENLNHLMPAGSPFTAKDLLGKPAGGKYLGGQVKKYANGGYISGKSGIDQIPAMLSEGEYVIKASSARQVGKSTLDRINAGKFYDGGSVDQSPLGESSSSTGGGNTNNINISINMERGKASSEENNGRH